MRLLKITPLAAESMGSRSMATFVESKKFRLLIDPGACITDKRFNLPPHPLETWRLEKLHDRIQSFFKSAQAIVITCFHDDHLTESFTALFKGKLLFIQNPNNHITADCRKKAFRFLKQVKGLPLDIIYMDNRAFQLGDLCVHFSKPCACEPEGKNGTCIPLAVTRENDSFVYSSHIAGGLDKKSLTWIINKKPTFFYLDGPSTTVKNRDQSVLSHFFPLMERLLKEAPPKILLLDHHILRDLNWRKKMEPLLKMAARYKVKLQTAAEYRGEAIDLLEARREQLYEDETTNQS
jgi:predicted metallo-beta-lactamase superfamily hydrolase